MAHRAFLSHGSRDEMLAKMIAEIISRISLQQIEVWYSSDPSPTGGLRPGQVWADVIKSQLLASRAILIVLTRNSLNLPWLYFESGYVSSQDCLVVPLCVGLCPRDVPLPLAMFQCYELNDLESLTHFCKKFLNQLQISFDEEMAAPILRCAAKTLKLLTPQATADVAKRDACTCEAKERVESCLAMLRNMFDDLPMPVHSIDETGVICNVNRQWLEVFGYPREEVIGKPADFLMTSKSAELAMLIIIPTFWEQGFCKNIPYQYKRRDGSLINVLLNCFATTDHNGKKMSLSFVQVVTNQEGLWQLRNESEATYGLRLQGEAAGFYETDLFGNFTTVNEYMRELLGFGSKEEVIGRNFRDLIDCEGAKNVFNAYHSVYTKRTLRKSYTWTIRRKGSHTITVECTISLITFPNGEARGFRGSVRKHQRCHGRRKLHS
jgi:PAS domain S-box-containing protein